MASSTDLATFSPVQLNGIYASLINYFLIIQGCTNQAFARNGRTSGMYDIGTTMYTSILWTVTFQISLAIGYWTWIHHLFIWGSMALWYLFCLAYDALPTNISPNVHKTFVEVSAETRPIMRILWQKLLRHLYAASAIFPSGWLRFTLRGSSVVECCYRVAIRCCELPVLQPGQWLPVGAPA